MKPDRTDRLIETFSRRDEADRACERYRAKVCDLGLAGAFGVHVTWLPADRVWGIYVGRHQAAGDAPVSRKASARRRALNERRILEWMTNPS